MNKINYKRYYEKMIESKEKLIEYYLYESRKKKEDIFKIVNVLENEINMLKSKLSHYE